MSKENQLSTEEAWEQILKRYDIVNEIAENGIFFIEASQIKEYREPRLMSKWDSSEQLPSILKKNNINILPNSRHSYVLGDFLLYQEIPELEEHVTSMTQIDLPIYESIDVDNINSESNAINVLVLSNILDDFLGTTNSVATFNGRMGTGQFVFNVDTYRGNKQKIEVNNAQCEIDGGFENDESVVILEAKNVVHSDFHVRQLYYPYRLWRRKVSKFVRPIFIEYTNGIYHLREYAFEDINHYNSIKLVKEKKYYLKDDSSRIINLQLLSDIADSITIVEESIDVPFPQADSFERIVNLCEIINGTKEGYILKDELSENYSFTEKVSFDKRQVDYYTNAASYLGLIEKGKDPLGNIYYELSDIGKKIFSVSLIDRQLVFVKLILSHRPFNETFKLYLQRAEVPSKDMIVSIMQHSMLNNVGSRTTYYRRASTIISWINWIINLIYE